MTQLENEKLEHTNKSIESIEHRIGTAIYERRRRRAIIYCRVSTDKQEQDGESLEYQEEKCRQYAELHDLDVLMVLKEAKSGFILPYVRRDGYEHTRHFP